MKRVISFVLAILTVSLLFTTVAFAAAGPSNEDLQEIKANVIYPKNGSYYSNYKYGYATPSRNNHAIYGFKNSSTTKNNTTIEKNVMFTILAKENDRYCVILKDSDLAYWVNAKAVTLIDEETFSNGYANVDGPSKWDLDEVKANVTYPLSGSYYSSYKYGYASPSGNNHAIYGFKTSTTTKNVVTIEQGTEFKILAKECDRYCVILEDSQLVYWVNAKAVQIMCG